jgi:hypothetical protein
VVLFKQKDGKYGLKGFSQKGYVIVLSLIAVYFPDPYPTNPGWNGDKLEWKR